MYEAVLPFPNIDPVLIHIWGPIAIRWYSLSYIAGLLAGWWLIARMLSNRDLWKGPAFGGKPPVTLDDMGDFVVWATLGVVIGGRLGWVIFYGTFLCLASPDGAMCLPRPWQGLGQLPLDFLYHPLRIVSAWDGGMSFHGGVLGLAAAIILFGWRKKFDPAKLGDLITSVAPLGLFFGRIANFINGELWGKPSNVPWAMVFPRAGNIPRHPSQLYEAALEGIVLFAILQIGYRTLRWRDRPGLTTATFFLGYSLFRIFAELFREPDAPLWGPISMGQVLSIPMWAIAAYYYYHALKPAAGSPQATASSASKSKT